MTDPARMMMSSIGWEGCWLTSENRLMNVTDMDDFDPEDFLSDGEPEENLERNGKMPIGAAYVDFLDEHNIMEGGCFLYWQDQDLVEWCEGNGFPRPVASLPDEAWDAVMDYFYYGHE